MPPEQPSGSRWWNRLPGRGGGGGLGSRGGSQGDLQHGEAPLSAAQQARDRLSRYSHFFIFHSQGSLMLALAISAHLVLKPAVALFDVNHIAHAPVGHLAC